MPEIPPEIRIVYCQGCGYLARALQLHAQIQEELEWGSRLEKGPDGVFEVRVNGRVVAEKRNGLLPEDLPTLHAIAREVSLQQRAARRPARGPVEGAR